MKLSLETRSWLRRRIPAYLLLIGMGAIILHYWQKKPSETLVTYRFGASRARLQSATMVYRRRREAIARVRFGFAHRKATKEVSHRVKLPDGDYDVDITLRYEKDDRRGSRGHDGGGQRVVKLRRLLLVRGDGAGIIFIDPVPAS
ncbi:MAG: hypothetical protein KAI47_03610 [Deltaproteobacteria bacterium]|nr:hypothetical protein [Deltaproteobacteria bacterium]